MLKPIIDNRKESRRRKYHFMAVPEAHRIMPSSAIVAVQNTNPDRGEQQNQRRIEATIQAQASYPKQTDTYIGTKASHEGDDTKSKTGQSSTRTKDN